MNIAAKTMTPLEIFSAIESLTDAEKETLAILADETLSEKPVKRRREGLTETEKGERMPAAENFYRAFRALPEKERLTVARHILKDEDIRQAIEIPNETTLRAFAEDKKEMPLFTSVDDLRKDMLS